MTVSGEKLADQVVANTPQDTMTEASISSQPALPVRQTFPKTDRLLRSTEFRRVYDRGQQLHSSLFTLFALRTAAPDRRLGITTSRKIGKAVQRNRCRRLLREVFRRHQRELPTGWDLIVNAKQPLTRASLAVVESEFLRLTKKLWKS